MTIITVWLLLMVSDGSYNHGTVTVIDNFPTREACLFVLQNIPLTRGGEASAARCVQAQRVVKK